MVATWANNAISGNDNTIVVEQSGDWHESYVRELSGDANLIDVTQDGYYNISDLTVAGSDNEVEIDQDGDQNVIGWTMIGDGNTLEFEQDGDGNEISTGVFEGSGNEVNIDQIGDVNLATVETIGGASNTFEINQVGEGNAAYAGVIGLLNEFDLTQVGDGNEISAVNFDGILNTVEIEQDGDGNLALAQAGIGDASYYADGNIIEMSQEGVENDASVELASNVTSSFNEIMVSQTGELNLLDLLVNGDENFISVTQEGVGNWVTDETGEQFVISGDMNTFEVRRWVTTT
jgi:Curlin associated repeat.